jgi:hypothetical protein
MKRFDILHHKGKQVFLIDVAHTQPDETVAVLRDAQPHIASQPPKSVLILTDVTDAPFNHASTAAMMDFANKNTPHVAASAVVGADSLRYVILQTIILVTGRNIRACKTRDEALAWLTSQG